MVHLRCLRKFFEWLVVVSSNQATYQESKHIGLLTHLLPIKPKFLVTLQTFVFRLKESVLKNRSSVSIKRLMQCSNSDLFRRSRSAEIKTPVLAFWRAQKFEASAEKKSVKRPTSRGLHSELQAFSKVCQAKSWGLLMLVDCSKKHATAYNSY